MSDYIDGLTKTNYIPNVVILFAGKYFAIRQPDSGLVIEDGYSQLVNRITVNPTRIDPLRATTTLNTSSFTLLDKSNKVSELFLNQRGFRTGQPVQIFLGRSNEGLDFSQYFALPTSYIKDVQKIDNAYSFSTIEQKDRVNNGSFSKLSKLDVDILAATTTITLQDISFLSGATSGFIKINSEFISFAAVDPVNNFLLGCIRGEFGTVPDNHEAGDDAYLVYSTAVTNAIDLLLQLLISSGGGGVYDVLPEGAAIDESLVDIAQFLEVKDAFFSTVNLDFKLYNISSLQRFIEDEILLPLGVRLRSNSNGKIGLALINRNIFEIDAPIISEENTSRSPKFRVSNDKVINRVKVFYDFSEGKEDFVQVVEKEDQESITEFGASSFREFRFRGLRSRAVAESIANLFLARYAVPRPDIEVETLNSTSSLLVGEKTELFSSKLPSEDGTLNFASTLEILKQAYNPVTGTVSYSLSFTSFSGLRQCFIAPSDSIVSHSSQKIVTLAAGRGAHYRAGWKMRLYSNNTRDYYGPQVNTIQSIVGDIITFQDDWIVPLDDFVSRITFADYDNVIEQQKKFCFINAENEIFNDGKREYQVTFA